MRKKYIITTILPLLFVWVSASAQTIKASVGVGSLPNRFKVYLTTDLAGQSTISTLQFNVGVESTGLSVAPALTVVSNALGALNMWTIDPAFNEGGYWNYNIYTSTSPLQPTFTANADFEAMELEFGSGLPAIGNAGLVTLPLGGSNGFAMFYCNGSVNSNGLGNLYYSKSGTRGITLDNQNSYDAGFSSGSVLSFVKIPNTVVLPVKFLNFTATKNNNTAVLNWAVENEDANTATYEIEKSINGVDFSFLKSLPALNNGKSSNNYNYVVDKLSSIRTSGMVYFRIKQIDKDGQFVYTPVRNVKVDGKNIAVVPNPVKATANVSFELPSNAEVTIAIFDAAGKQVSAYQAQGFKGTNINRVDMSKLTTGNYTLKVQTATDVQVIPVVKASN